MLLEKFFDSRLDTVLEEAVKNDKRYQSSSKKISEEVNKIDQIGLNHHQWDVVDNAMSACNNRGLEYGRVSYFQGFQDAVNFVAEICGML